MLLSYRKFPKRNDIILASAALPLYIAGVGKYGFRVLIMLALVSAVGYALEKLSARIRGRDNVSFNFPAWILFPLI